MVVVHNQEFISNKYSLFLATNAEELLRKISAKVVFEDKRGKKMINYGSEIEMQNVSILLQMSNGLEQY